MNPFDWMETPRAPVRPQATGQTRDDEVRRRAMLFADLGYPQKTAEQRLKANFDWEYEGVGKPAILKRVAGLVAEAYGRSSPAPQKKKKKKKR